MISGAFPAQNHEISRTVLRPQTRRRALTGFGKHGTLQENHRRKEADADMQEFSPAETQRAPDVIYDQIYQRIVSGKLKPGDRLPSERVLAEQFQRSRHIIREALRMLQQDGLITIEVGSAGGAVIQGISIDMLSAPLKKYLSSGDLDLRELTEYRYLNDFGCARFAALHRTEADIRAMAEALEQVKASIDHDEAFFRHDIDFHHALAEASHNRLAILVNDAVIRMATEQMERSVRTSSRRQRAELHRRIYETHSRIFQAVVAGDVAEAGRCADAVVDLFRSQNPPGAEPAQGS